MQQERKEFYKWAIVVASVLILIALGGFILNSLGIIGTTVVEREVFKRSHQYKEAKNTAIATFEAQLTEIQLKLNNTNIDPDTRANLEAQAASVRIQLARERNK